MSPIVPHLVDTKKILLLHIHCILKVSVNLTSRVVHFEIVPYQRYTGTTIGKIIVPVQKLVQ